MKPEYISYPDWEILKKRYPHDLDKVLKKLNEAYPVQYLIGYVEFLNTKIKVDKRALIPRFETEYLTDKLIKLAKKTFKDKIDILDLGTGSGAIAIALKKNLNCNINALDISNKALDLAKSNALLNKVEINFINQDMTKSLINKYDIIVSNPPYIKKGEYVSLSVSKYEPSLALYAKDNGLYYYKVILNKHLNNLNKPGIIALEIGDNQKELLEQIVNKLNKKYYFEKDLNNIYRYLFILNE